jgi:hypothetical protein
MSHAYPQMPELPSEGKLERKIYTQKAHGIMESVHALYLIWSVVFAARERDSIPFSSRSC